jgi:hypothetical protein
MNKPLVKLLVLGLGIGLVVAGCTAQSRPRTNLQDDLSWSIAGVGVSLISVAFMLHVLRPPRLVPTLIVAIVAPFWTFFLLVLAFWGFILLSAMFNFVRQSFGWN